MLLSNNLYSVAGIVARLLSSLLYHKLVHTAQAWPSILNHILLCSQFCLFFLNLMHLPLEIDKPFLYTICGLRDINLKIAFKVSPGKGGIAHG